MVVHSPATTGTKKTSTFVVKRLSFILLVLPSFFIPIKQQFQVFLLLSSTSERDDGDHDTHDAPRPRPTPPSRLQYSNLTTATPTAAAAVVIEGNVTAEKTTAAAETEMMMEEDAVTDRRSLRDNIRRQASNHTVESTTTVSKSETPEQGQSSLPQRIDTAGPHILMGRTYTLPSLPLQHRVSSLDDFYERREQLDGQPYYYYNPSIIPIPDEYRRYINFTDDDDGGGGGTSSDNYCILGSNNKCRRRPSYIVSFRLSTGNACGIPFAGGTDNNGLSNNLLGLAILDEQLDILPNSDVVIDFISYFRNKTGVKNGGFEDFRLLSHHGRIYLTHRWFLVRVHISTPALKPIPRIFSVNNATTTSTSFQAEQPQSSSAESSNHDSATLNNVFGGGLNVQVVGLSKSNRIKGPTRDGKNFGFLPMKSPTDGLESATDDDGSNKVVVEYKIGSPRQIYEVDLLNYRVTNEISLGDPSYVPEPSFRNEHEDYMNTAFIQTDRGTACCVKIFPKHFHHLLETTSLTPNSKSTTTNVFEGMEYLWVGVAHTKSKKRTENISGFVYLSRLYALSPQYELIARTGFLCFGFPTLPVQTNASVHGGVDFPPSNHNNEDPHVHLTHHSKVVIEGTEYNCPRIEFVSGISEKVDDPDTVLLGYGVNDCVARIVQVEKQQLANRLFGVMT